MELLKGLLMIDDRGTCLLTTLWTAQPCSVMQRNGSHVAGVLVGVPSGACFMALWLPAFVRMAGFWSLPMLLAGFMILLSSS
jgi:hypothetical protein